MKKRIFTLLLVLVMALSVTTAYAATIDTTRTASLDIYKYDMTAITADGDWNPDSYVSNGQKDDAVINALKSYAVQGVEFTYLKVADIATHSAKESDAQYRVQVQYGFTQNDTSAAVLAAVGLSYDDAVRTEGAVSYFIAEDLSAAFSTALAANATTVKNAVEPIVKASGVAMTETDDQGHTSADALPLGLYLVSETKVPENVTTTCNPFLVSLPMTTLDGSAWNYDVTVYPKNDTGMPTLEKLVTNNSTFNHTATASGKDVLSYQITSKLPVITSAATNLTTYTFVDELSTGLTYRKDDVKIEFFKDEACAEKITTWTMGGDKFAVAYDDVANTMTISMKEAGLTEMNTATTVHNSVEQGYSGCTMRLTYGATIHADKAVLGDSGNPNDVTLTWKRTNDTYFDTLTDDCHVYSYGIDLLKKFSDDNGNATNVKFLIQQGESYLVATAKDGVYYVTGTTTQKNDATVFAPTSAGHLIVKGLEAGNYTLTETATDSDYVLLRDSIKVVITANESETCAECGDKLLTAAATINGKAADMDAAHAIVPLTVTNNRGFELPKTGSYGTWMFTVGGVLLLGAAAVIVAKSKKIKAE